MEIKIHCDCGQKIKFDVEPVNGRMPWELTCPVCGASGTAKANQIIAQTVQASPSAPIGSVSSAPAPIRIVPQILSAPAAAPEAAAAAATSEPPKPRLSISRPHPPAASAAPEPPRPMPGPSAFKPTMGTSKPKIENIFGEPHMGKTILGAVIGSLIGVTLWWVLFHFTEIKWGIMAVAVGWLAGFLARWIGRSEGQQMGIVTALIALTAIISFQAWRAHTEMTTSDKEIDVAYAEELKDAKKLIEAVPNGTGDEIKTHLRKQFEQLGITPEANYPDPEDMKTFKEDDWQPAKDLVDGKKSKEDYRKEYRASEKELNDTVVFKIIFWIKAIGVFNIFFIAIGVALAYRFGSGEG